jgi:hypothetical protein
MSTIQLHLKLCVLLLAVLYLTLFYLHVAPYTFLLTQAYEAAEEGDVEPLLELQQIFADPYRTGLQV